MSGAVTFYCPGCDNRISIRGSAIASVGDEFGNVGCLNSEDHEDGEPLVMYEEDS